MLKHTKILILIWIMYILYVLRRVSLLRQIMKWNIFMIYRFENCMKITCVNNKQGCWQILRRWNYGWWCYYFWSRKVSTYFGLIIHFFIAEMHRVKMKTVYISTAGKNNVLVPYLRQKNFLIWYLFLSNCLWLVEWNKYRPNDNQNILENSCFICNT